MIARRAVLAAAGALATTPAFAIDPGVAKGGYRGDDVSFDVTHAVALAMDGAEGFGGKNDVRVRLVLSDVEVAPSALTGLAFPPIWSQGRTGKVKGFLLEFDPADRTVVYITVLAPPEPGYSLATRTVSNTAGVWASLNAGPTRISGELRTTSTTTYASASQRRCSPTPWSPTSPDLRRRRRSRRRC